MIFLDKINLVTVTQRMMVSDQLLVQKYFASLSSHFSLTFLLFFSFVQTKRI